MIVRRSIGQNVLFTRFLMERDYLSASFTRIGSGFCPASEIINAREKIQNITWLLDQLDKIKDVNKDTPVEIKDFYFSQKLQ